MGCNCMTSQQLDELYRNYGAKKDGEKETLANKAKRLVKKGGVALVMCIITPLILVYVLYVTYFGDGKISLKDFFGLKDMNIEEYVRKQQDIQNKNRDRGTV